MISTISTISTSGAPIQESPTRGPILSGEPRTGQIGSWALRGVRGLSFQPRFEPDVPSTLLQALDLCTVEPVLIGPMAARVWGGECGELFKGCRHGIQVPAALSVDRIADSLYCLFGTPHLADGPSLEIAGRWFEFQSGSLRLGEVVFGSPQDCGVAVPLICLDGNDTMWVMRPEAVVLERLAEVAETGSLDAYCQARCVYEAQRDQDGWDSDWLETLAPKVRVCGLLQALIAHEDSNDSTLSASIASMGWDQD